MKYTVSGSTLQYKVGLTLSFLSLISRGVGPFQKGNTSILLYIIQYDTYSTVQYSTRYCSNTVSSENREAEVEGI